jgi:hypothetical protein
MIEKVFSDTISDFALILAPCRALKSTNLTIQSSSFKCTEGGCLVGLVDLRARHSAKIRAKKWYFTRYLVLKGCDKLQNSRASVRPSYICRYHPMVRAGPRQ